LSSRFSCFPKYSTLTSSTMYLPEELKVEILSRVSAASLARSQSVSKRWNALIKDEKFTKKRFLQRSHATVIMLIENRVYLVSVNLHETHNNMVKTIDWLFGIRFHVKPGGFNQEEPTRDSITLLLAVGEIGDWFILRRNGRVMSVNGNAYWLASTRGNVDFLQSFDFSTERITRVSLPGDRHSYHIFSLSVTREEQKLCLLTQDEPVGIATAKVPSINVWMATKIKSNGAASWIKFLSVNFANIHKPFCFHNGMNFLVDPENKVFVCPGKNGFSKTFLNILGENKSIQVEHQDAESVCSLLVNYVPTLVQIQQGSSKKV
ncbi:F-box domain, partial [Arabidopsis thaliana x Arabidopsis arenosa]